MKQGDVIASKYRLISRIGQGGMGSVWHVTNTQTGRDFAIKFLHAAVATNDDSRYRFMQEARASARINHPNAIDIFDVGETEDGGLYLVMELLDGISLGDALRSEPPFTARDLFIVLAEACTALHAAHNVGVVHRDLKPPNIFLHRDRATGYISAKVLDFGVSKLTSADDGVATHTGSLLGSPRYMSPEQAISASAADGRSDVWSIGIILFEALTGRFPHDGDSSNNLIIAIATKPPKAIHTVAPHLPLPIRMLVDDCLRPVDQRVQTVGQLLDRMLSLLATHDLGEMQLARPTVAKGKARARPEGLLFRTMPGQIPGLATSMLQAQGLGDLARHLRAGGALPAPTPQHAAENDDATSVIPLEEMNQRLAARAQAPRPWDASLQRAQSSPSFQRVDPQSAPQFGTPPQTPHSYAGQMPMQPPQQVPAPRASQPSHQSFPHAMPADAYAQVRSTQMMAPPPPANFLPPSDPMMESISSINVVRGGSLVSMSSPPPVNALPAASSKSNVGLIVIAGGVFAAVAAGAIVLVTTFGKREDARPKAEVAAVETTTAASKAGAKAPESQPAASAHAPSASTANSAAPAEPGNSAEPAKSAAAQASVAPVAPNAPPATPQGGGPRPMPSAKDPRTQITNMDPFK